MSIWQSIQRAVGDFNYLPNTTNFEELDGERVTSEVIDTDALENGVAGDGNTITSVFGDSTEYLPVAVVPIPGDFSTTSTSYTGVSDTTVEDYRLPLSDLQLTNTDQYGVTFVTRSNNDTSGETTSVRVASVPETEVTVTGTTFVTNETSITDVSALPSRVGIEMKVTGGTGRTFQSALGIWRKIA